MSELNWLKNVLDRNKQAFASWPEWADDQRSVKSAADSDQIRHSSNSPTQEELKLREKEDQT